MASDVDKQIRDLAQNLVSQGICRSNLDAARMARSMIEGSMATTKKSTEVASDAPVRTGLISVSPMAQLEQENKWLREQLHVARSQVSQYQIKQREFEEQISSLQLQVEELVAAQQYAQTKLPEQQSQQTVVEAVNTIDENVADQNVIAGQGLVESQSVAQDIIIAVSQSEQSDKSQYPEQPTLIQEQAASASADVVMVDVVDAAHDERVFVVQKEPAQEFLQESSQESAQESFQESAQESLAQGSFDFVRSEQDDFVLASQDESSKEGFSKDDSAAAFAFSSPLPDIPDVVQESSSTTSALDVATEDMEFLGSSMQEKSQYDFEF